MTLYEKDACFAPEPGQVVDDLDSIRRTLQSFVDMGAKLEVKVNRVVQASDSNHRMVDQWNDYGMVLLLLLL